LGWTDEEESVTFGTNRRRLRARWNAARRDLAKLTPDQREAWEERVAICMFHGDVDQAVAEDVAWVEVENT